MALMMVAATAFTALATWRTYKVSELIFAISDRPFLGVKKVTFERTDSPEPVIVVDFRNFGPIPADDAIIAAEALLDGKPIPPHDGEGTASDQGTVSPGVPHFFYVFLNSGRIQKDHHRDGAPDGAGQPLIQRPGTRSPLLLLKEAILRFPHLDLPSGRWHCGPALIPTFLSEVAGWRKIWQLLLKMRCAICRKPVDMTPANRFRPFCSERLPDDRPRHLGERELSRCREDRR